MLSNSYSSLTRISIAVLGLASASSLISLPVAAQIPANFSGVDRSLAKNIPAEHLPLKATAGLNTVAQVGLRTIANDLITANNTFSSLATAVTVAELTEALAQTEPLTFFAPAPVDEAFRQLPTDIVQALLRLKN